MSTSNTPGPLIEKADLDRVRKNLYNAIVFLVSFIVIASISLIFYVLLPYEAERGLTAAPGTENAAKAEQKAESDLIEDGIHLASGLVAAEGYESVIKNCTACHSGQLVRQNRASREGWEEMIRWMQNTQGLWQLGDQKDIILDYLAKNYGPKPVSRRAKLDLEDIEWYILEQ
jgi:cytochrome c1